MDQQKYIHIIIKKIVKILKIYQRKKERNEILSFQKLYHL